MMGNTIRPTRRIDSGNGENIPMSKVNQTHETQYRLAKTPEVYLGTTLDRSSSQVDPFYIILLINNKLVNNCTLD